jgi:hypothetical protein
MAKLVFIYHGCSPLYARISMVDTPRTEAPAVLGSASTPSPLPSSASASLVAFTGSCIVTSSPNQNLVFAMFGCCLGFVEPLQCPVMSLIQPIIADNWNPHLVELVKNHPEHVYSPLKQHTLEQHAVGTKFCEHCIENPGCDNFAAFRRKE